MTTIRHCSILGFGRGHPIKQSPRASPDLCTPLAQYYVIFTVPWSLNWSSEKAQISQDFFLTCVCSNAFFGIIGCLADIRW